MHPATLHFQLRLSAAEEDPLPFAVSLHVEFKLKFGGSYRVISHKRSWTAIYQPAINLRTSDVNEGEAGPRLAVAEEG